jgi:hypothetical protein
LEAGVIGGWAWRESRGGGGRRKGLVLEAGPRSRKELKKW